MHSKHRESLILFTFGFLSAKKVSVSTKTAKLWPAIAYKSTIRAVYGTCVLIYDGNRAHLYDRIMKCLYGNTK